MTTQTKLLTSQKLNRFTGPFSERDRKGIAGMIIQ